MATLERPGINVQAELQKPEVQKVVSTGIWGDDAALKLVIQDSQRAENYESTKQWVMFWPTATALYQSPFAARYWEGTQTERANIPFYTVALHVNSLAPQIIKGLFYDDPPFLVENRPGTKSQAARAMGAVVGYQLGQIKFRESLRLGVVNALLFGTTIWKWGWESFIKKRKIYKRETPAITIPSLLGGETGKPTTIAKEDEINIYEEEIEETVDQPTFEHIVNLRHVLVDPGLQVPDIRKAKYVIHRMYLTWNDLEKLRDRPGINLPSKEKLLELFIPPKEEPLMSPAEVSIRNPLWDARAEPRFIPSTADPLNQPLEILERWDNDRVIMVLQQKLVILNDKNPYGVIPFLSVGWWDVPEAFFSMGLAKTIGSFQRLSQGVTNTWLDQLALNLNGVYTRVRGKSIPTQSIRISPGKIVDIDNQGDLAPLQRTAAVPEAMEAMELSERLAEAYSGASEPSTQGIAGSSGHSNLARTAAGANLLASGQGSRIEDFIEKLADNVYVPFLYAVHEMNCRLLPIDTLKNILNEELKKEFQLQEDQDLLELLNARLSFEVLAAAKLQARRVMAQSLPILTQILQQRTVLQALAMEGKKVDMAEIVRMFFEVSEWKNVNDVIVPMTDEDKKRWEMLQPGAQLQTQLAAKQQQQQIDFEQRQALLDQENISKAAREVLRQGFEQSATPFTVTGEAGGKGFGSVM